MTVAVPPLLQPGDRRVVTVSGHEVAVFNVEGRLFAIGNRCPHRGGPLARGRLELVSGTGSGIVPEGDRPSGGTVAIRCPIHGWLFCLATGRCLNQPDAQVPTYVVECRGSQLCVQP